MNTYSKGMLGVNIFTMIVQAVTWAATPVPHYWLGVGCSLSVAFSLIVVLTMNWYSPEDRKTIYQKALQAKILQDIRNDDAIIAKKHHEGAL